MDGYLEVVGIEADTLTEGAAVGAGGNGHLLLEGDAVSDAHTLSLFDNVLHGDKSAGRRVRVLCCGLGQATRVRSHPTNYIAPTFTLCKL